MSTLRTTKIQHPSSNTPSITLSSDGSVAIPGLTSNFYFDITVAGSGGVSDWTGTDPYVATISVPGVLSTDRPLVDLNLSAVTFADVAGVEADWSLVYRVEASDDDEIKIYAKAEPTESFNITVKVGR